MPKGKGYKDYDSAGKKKSIAKRLGKAAIEVAADPAGYSKMFEKANIAKAPSRAKTKNSGRIAGRSPAKPISKKSDAGKRVVKKKAAAKARVASVDKVDAGRRRSQVAVKRGAAKKAATRSVAMATEKKRDRTTSRNRRYKDDRASRD
jgi:DNA replication initiation complex subunit (GINS family)